MKNDETIFITLEENAWNILQEVSQSAAVPLHKEAEILLTLKLFQEFPSKEKSELIAETEAFSPKFSLIVIGILRRLFGFRKINKYDSTSFSVNEKNNIRKYDNKYEFEISVAEHQFRKLENLAIVNNSSTSIEASRMLTEYLLEKFSII